MPTYQYACTECGERLEAVQSFSDDPLTVCPVCGGRLRKVYSAVGIVFKGSGFYRTDSRAADSRAADSRDSGSRKPDSRDADGGRTTKGAGDVAGTKEPAAAGAAGDGAGKGTSGSSGGAGSAASGPGKASGSSG